MNTQAAKAINTPYLSISGPTVINEIQAPKAGFIDRSGFFLVRDNAHFSFHVSAAFIPHFTLIKGLIEFHRPKELLFSFDRIDHRIEVKITHGQLALLTGFLQSINGWLIQELRFKTALKVVLEFESRYRKEQDSVYSSLSLAMRAPETFLDKSST